MLILILKFLRSLIFGCIGVSAIFVGINARLFANELTDDEFLANYARFLSWLFMLGGVGNIIAALLLMQV